MMEMIMEMMVIVAVVKVLVMVTTLRQECA